MKMYLLSDNVDTLIGMRLSGVGGVVVHEENEIRQALEQAMQDEDIAVILMTEKVVEKIRDTVYEWKLNRRKPLIVEIPDRHGSGRSSDAISRYVQDAIGIKLD